MLVRIIAWQGRSPSTPGLIRFAAYDDGSDTGPDQPATDCRCGVRYTSALRRSRREVSLCSSGSLAARSGGVHGQTDDHRASASSSGRTELPGRGWLVCRWLPSAACATLAATHRAVGAAGCWKRYQHVEAVFRGSSAAAHPLAPAGIHRWCVEHRIRACVGSARRARPGPHGRVWRFWRRSGGGAPGCPIPRSGWSADGIGRGGLCRSRSMHLSAAPPFHPRGRSREVVSGENRTATALFFGCRSQRGCSPADPGKPRHDFRVETFGAPALAWLPLFVVFGFLTRRVWVPCTTGCCLWFLDRRRRRSASPDPGESGRHRLPSARRLAMFACALAGRRQRPLTQRNPRRTPVRSFRRHRLPCGAVHRAWPTVVLGCCARRNIQRRCSADGCAGRWGVLCSSEASTRRDGRGASAD